MKPTRRPRPIVASSLLLTAMLTACAVTSEPPLPVSPVVVAPPAIPRLPEQARQPPAPPICSPTCLDGWNRLVENLRQSLNSAALPATPASAPTTR